MKAVKDELLYMRYDGSQEYCWLCRACDGSLRSASIGSQRYLCVNHFALYQDEVEKIRAGKRPFPSGFDKDFDDERYAERGLTPDLNKAKEQYLTDCAIWTRLRVLEFMVENGEITEEKAKEQADVIVKDHRYRVVVGPLMEQRRIEEERRRNSLPKFRIP